MESSPTLPANNRDEEFFKSHELFFDTLSGNERSQFKSCRSPEELLEEVKKFIRFKGEKRTWTRPFECIKRFSDNLAPFFDIIGTFIQSNPQWSAIAWGVVRFILQLADNFTTFFDKLTEILDQIGRTLPRYKEIRDLAPKDMSVRLRPSLIDLYRDLFEFFTSVACVFTQKSGKLRPAPFVISKLLLKPFGVRYSNFLKRLEFHRTVLDEEESLMQTKTLFQVKQSQDERLHRAEEERRSHNDYKNLVYAVKQKVSAAELKSIGDAVKDWLELSSPDEIQEPLWDAQHLREDNTCTWIFDDHRFVAWNESDPVHSDQHHPLSNTLWVRGNPGTGKSVLAASVLDWLGTSGSNDGDRKQALAYFFFSFRSSPTRRSSNAYREILSQIFRQLQEDDEVLDCFTFAATKSVTSRASTKDLLALLKLLAQHVSRLTLLLDGVDESDDPDDFIKSLVTCFSGTPAKMILFSRPNIGILMSTPVIAQITLSRQSVEDDIQIYLARRLEDLREKRLPPDCAKEKILAHLLDSANGMFLWARLMMDYLESPALEPPETRLAMIWKTTPHENLNDMYIRILRLMATKIRPERDMARRILYWLAFHGRPLYTSELWEAMYCLKTASPPPGLTDHIIPSQKQAEDFDYAVVMVCACFVERTGSRYRLIHQSVVEFFWRWSEERFCNDPDVLQFLVEPAEAHGLLANECLSYLIFRIPAQPLSGDMREGLSKQRIRDGFPLVQYASLYWTRHLKECLVYIKDATQTGSQRNPSLLTRAFLDLLRTLSTFLANKLFANTWVELQYMVCSHTTLPSHIDDLGEWCQLMESFPQKHLPEDLQELSTKIRYLHKDMLALNSAWGPTLEENPHYIWNDVTAFQECSSFIKTSAVTVRSMAPSQFDKRTLASKPLVSLSRERVDSELTGVLSIWPPRLFEDAWPKATESVGDLPCEGWVARFEVWNVRSGAKEKVNDIRIPLDASTVKDHVDHSITLRKVFEGQKNRTTPTIFNKWSLSFPTAISSDIDVLVILNTAYILDLSSNNFIRDIRLPTTVLETSSTSTEEGRLKTQKQPKHRPLRESLRLARSYSFLISNNGEYILRQDAKSLVSIHVGNPVVYSLTAIGFDRMRQTSYIIGQFGDNDAGIDINSCSFHPTLPLALFFTRCFGGGRNVVLWAFTGENRGKQQLSDPASSKSETLSNLGPPQTGIELLHFSACGKNVIFKCTGKPLPDVFSLEGNPVYTIALQLQQELPSPSSTAQAYSTDLTLLDNPNQSLIVPKQRIYQGQTLMTHSSSYQVNLSHRQTQSHLELTKVSDNIKTRQHLISFPDSWTDVDNSVNIALSNTGGADQNIKMVLNQGHKQWYDPTETREMHFPIIVEKDSRAFLRAESQNFGQGRKRSAAEMLKFSAENEQVGDEQNAPKQRLIEYGSDARGDRGATSSYASFENDATGE